MTAPLIAHRYEPLGDVREDGGFLRRRARDLVSSTEGELLSLRGRRSRESESILRLRFWLDGRHAADLLSIHRDDQGVHLFLAALIPATESLAWLLPKNFPDCSEMDVLAGLRVDSSGELATLAALGIALDRSARSGEGEKGFVELPHLGGQTLSWAEEFPGRSCLELWPWVAPARIERLAPEDPPALLVLRRFRSIAAFAETWWKLRLVGWLDGRELVLVELEAAPSDQASRLFLDELGPRRLASTGSNFPPSPVVAPASRIGAMLHAAGRPVSANLLARALDLDAASLTEEIVVALGAGEIDCRMGIPQDSLALPQLLLQARRSEAPVGKGLLRRLAATLLERGGGRGPGGLWLRMMAALEVGDPSRARQMHGRILKRAEKEGLPILAYAAHELRALRATELGASLEETIRSEIRRAEEHRLRSEVEVARDILAAAADRLRESEANLDSGQIAVLHAELSLEQAQLALQRSRYELAEKELSRTLEEYRDSLPSHLRARLYLDLSWAMLALGRSRESARYGELALRLMDPAREPKLVARAHNQLGTAHYRESRYEESLQEFQRGLNLREQMGDPLAVARSYNNLSLAQRGLGRYAAAERSLRYSLELKKAGGTEQGVAATRLNLGFVALDQGKFTLAEEQAEAAHELAIHAGHRDLEAESLGLRGEISLARGEAEAALGLFEKDLKICREVGHRSELLATLRRGVETLLELDRREEAARMLEEARGLLADLPSRFEAAWLDRLEADLLTLEGTIELGVDLYAASARSFAELHRHDLQLESLARLVGGELALGRRADARQTHRELRDSMARHEVHRLPASLPALEAELAREGGGVANLGGRRALTLLGDWLREMAANPRSQTSIPTTLTAALGAEQIRWYSGSDPKVLPRELGALMQNLEAGGERFQADGRALLVGPSGEGWLFAHREGGWPEAERELLRAFAAALELKGRPAVGSLESTRSQPAESTVNTMGLIGQAEGMVRVREMIQTLRDTNVNVLLLGENGTGKDVVARALHRHGVRAAAEYLAINCAAIPAGLLESELFGHEKGAFTSADRRRVGLFERGRGGTVFLDEIAEMPLAMQSKLLRVLQDGSFMRVGGSELLESDARIVAATNRDLRLEVEQGRFRMDLFYRLDVVRIEVPPLRERREDIEALAIHFLQRHGEALRSDLQRISPEALERLREYSWPGNVRELENVIRGAMVFGRGEELAVEDLPPQLLRAGEHRGRQGLASAVKALVEAEGYDEDHPLQPQLEALVAHALVERVGNKALAARLLGITKPTLYSRLKRYEALYGQLADREGLA